MVLVIVFVLWITAMLLVLLLRRCDMRLLARLHLRRVRLLAMFRLDYRRPFMHLRWRCGLLLRRYDMRLFAVLLRNTLPPLVRLRSGFHSRLRLGSFW